MQTVRAIGLISSFRVVGLTRIGRQFATSTSICSKNSEQVAEHVAEWTPNSLRTGVLAVKLGMTQTWTEWGERIGVTALQIQDNQVVDVRTTSTHGYNALQIGAVDVKKMKRVTKPLIGMYKKLGVAPKKYLSEFKVTEDALLPVGTPITAHHFVAGQLVDITGTTVGKGFAGVMKRHNMSGGNDSHGSTKQHRKIGSIGAGGVPSRVWPGKRMAGHMGNAKTTIRNLEIYKIDTRWNIIYIRGSVPGHKNGLLRVFDAQFNKSKEPLPFPTFTGEPEQGVFIAPKETVNPLASI